MLARYEYDVFVAIRNETGTSDNTRKFTGKEFGVDSNLYYYAARYYDPYIGRFTQRDSIGDGVNWYAYVANNPLKFVDPTGLELIFRDSGVRIADASAIDKDFDKLTSGEQTPFYGLFGVPDTTPDAAADDTISLSEDYRSSNHKCRVVLNEGQNAKP